MKVIDLLTKALEHEGVWDLIDHFVVLRLKESLALNVHERERLDEIKKHRELKEHEEADWECLVQDIAAMNRIIDYYGVK